MDDLKKYSPQFQHINDTLAFVVHLSFLKSDCKLIGLSEEQYLDDLGSVPQGWNKSNEIYQFRYVLKSQPKQKQDEQKNNDDDAAKNTNLVKILAMEQNQLLATAVKQGSNDVLTLEVALSDHIDINKASKNLNEYQSVYKDINGLLVLLNDQITHKIIPSKKKPDEEQKDKDKKDKKQNQDNDPLIFPEPNQPRNPLMVGPGGRRPGGGIPFGQGDLDPFAGGGGGGNLFGPNAINQQVDPNNNRPPLVPPNARFDPFGPGGMPPGPDPDHFNPPRRPPRGGGGGGLGGFGGGGGFGGFGGIM